MKLLKIIRNKETIKINWKSKINVKRIKKKNDEYIQYTVNLPAFLVKLFDLQKNTEYYERWLVFYKFKGNWCLGKHTYYLSNHEKDSVFRMKAYESTAYINGNSYRLTLCKEIFDNQIKKDEDNYLLFSLDTNKFSEYDNLQGVVTVKII